MQKPFLKVYDYVTSLKSKQSITAFQNSTIYRQLPGHKVCSALWNL